MQLVFHLWLAIFSVANSCSDARRLSIDEDIVASEIIGSAQKTRNDNNTVVELDILLTPEQLAVMKRMRNQNGIAKRNALRDLQRRWTNAVVPYYFDTGFSPAQQKVVRQGIDEWNRYSCIVIRPKRPSDKVSIKIVPRGTCASQLGMLGIRNQKITLGPMCVQVGVVTHEFGHALGFHHEQTRPDRDQYVRILKQNVMKSMFYNFKKYDSSFLNSHDVPYDYESVMHYGSKAFSINGKTTIQTLDPKYQKVIGNRFGVSFLDIKLINLMYDCNKKCPRRSCPGSGFVGKDCKCWCKGPSKEKPAVYCDTKKPVARSTSTGGRDKYFNCPTLARQGKCKSKIIRKNCKRSCKPRL